jgi:hypothetical protein
MAGSGCGWIGVYGAGKDSSLRRTKNLYYCSHVGSRIQVEMIQYLRVAADGPALETAYLERLSA